MDEDDVGRLRRRTRRPWSAAHPDEEIDGVALSGKSVTAVAEAKWTNRPLSANVLSEWPALREFRDRTRELRELEEWWASTSRDPVNLYGRRRGGKSWLFRRFAHGKPAVILYFGTAISFS